MLKVFGINSPKNSNKDNDDMLDSIGDDTGDDADLVNVVEYGYDDHGRLQGYQAKKQQQPKRSSTNSKNLTNSGRQDDDDEMGCVRTIVLQSAPLLVILLLLAFWIGDDSGWDWSETIYYFVITGTSKPFVLWTAQVSNIVDLALHELTFVPLLPPPLYSMYCWIRRLFTYDANG